MKTKSYLWDMLLQLEAEKLPEWLYKPELWNSLYVDYEQPFVERLWLQVDPDHRLFMHRVLPCEADQSLWHPHPWPSVVKVMGGSAYEQGIGSDAEYAMTHVSYGVSMYEMLNPCAWHYVRPIDTPSWSLMLTGKPFEEPTSGYVRPHKKLDPLSEDKKLWMLDYWKRMYMVAPF